MPRCTTHAGNRMDDNNIFFLFFYTRFKVLVTKCFKNLLPACPEWIEDDNTGWQELKYPADHLDCCRVLLSIIAETNRCSGHPLPVHFALMVSLAAIDAIFNTWHIKGIVRPFEFGGLIRLIRSSKINWRPGKFFFNFNATVSREEHKTILSSLRISEMALSNQSDLPVFILSPTSHLIGFCKSCEMALAIEQKIPLCFILLLPSPTIPEDDLPRMAKSRKMTYWSLANSGLRQAGIDQAKKIWFRKTSRSIMEGKLHTYVNSKKNHMVGRRWQEYGLSNLSPNWLACHLGKLSPHWLIGVPLEYDEGCNDDKNTDLWSTTLAISHLIGW